MSELSAFKRLLGLAFIICMVNVQSVAQDEGADLSKDKGETNETFKDLSPEEIEKLQRIIRQKLEFEAKELVRQGQELFFSQKYFEAIEKFTTAEQMLKDISADNEGVKERVKEVRSYLKQAFIFYARQLVNEGMREKKSGNFESAKKSILKAGELDPSLKPMIQKWLEELEQKKNQILVEEQIQVDNVDPEKTARDRDITVGLEKGKIFLRHKQWTRARGWFEKVLLIEPGNEEAIRHLRTVYSELRRIAIDRRKQQLVMYMAEVDWKWIDPIPAAERGASAARGTDVVIKNKKGGIHEKLEKIILPRISFEDASIRTVIKYLQDRSKELDFIDGSGVNIILLEKPKNVQAPAAAEPVDDFEEEGFDDTEFGGDEAAEAAPAAAAANDGDIPPITIEFDQIPMGEAIRYICTGANLIYRIEEHAVIIAHPDVSPTPFETRFYPVDPQLFQNAATDGEDGEGATDYQRFFENMGVDFPVSSKTSEKATVAFDGRTSKMIVRNTIDNLRKIERILKELIISPQQVTIESKFVEVEQTVLDELSFKWSFLGDLEFQADGTVLQGPVDIGGHPRHTGLGVNPDGFSGGNALSSGTRSLNQVILGDAGNSLLSFDTVLGNLNFNTLIYWFDQKNNLDLLSAPKVTVLSGAEAYISMIEERRFPESFEEAEFAVDDGIVTFTPSTPVYGEPRMDIGITLTVTPTVQNDEISINLELSPKVVVFKGYDETFNTVAVVGSGDEQQEVPLIFSTPVFEVREIRTQVTVWDGETVVLGGTIRHDRESVSDNIPFLSDLPLLGRLFQSRGERSVKRNLLIFVTARIIDPSGLPKRSHDIRGLPDFRR